MARKKDVKEEVSEEAKEEEPNALEAIAAEENEEDTGGEQLMFAMSPIVRLMKEEMDGDKMIRKGVKINMNKWLEKLCRKIAKKMNRSDYTVIEVDDFKTAIEPYEMIDDVELERQRIVATLEKIKMDCDSLIRDVNRKFITPETFTGEIGGEGPSEVQ